MSSCVISWHFRAIPHIDQKQNLAWLKNAAEAINVRLRGLVDEYAVNEDLQDFVAV